MTIKKHLNNIKDVLELISYILAIVTFLILIMGHQ